MKGVLAGEGAHGLLDFESAITMTETGRILLQLGEKLEMRKLKTGEMFRFHWRCEREEGVFTSKFFKWKIVDHFIVVNAGKNIILNSSERFPLELKP